jgi:hypothetical protein
VEDRLAESLHQLDHDSDRETTVAALAKRYSYVCPEPHVLELLTSLGPLVEMGAGTGYWAYKLRGAGADVIAFDQAPLDGDRANRYHDGTTTWSRVLPGDHEILSAYYDRALFLCWPPLFSALGESLLFYRGNVVAYIGDGGHRTARLLLLNDEFTLVDRIPVIALDPSPEVRPSLTIWRRRQRSAP